MDVKNKKFWEEFIELYRQNTCVCDVKSKDYLNKTKRNAGYDILFQKFKELFPEATLEAMKKKINNIRTSFRRELKKGEDSKRTGSGADDIYEPSLWYYDILFFTAESERGRKGKSNDEEMEVDREQDKNNLYNEETDDFLYSPHTPASFDGSVDTQLDTISQHSTASSGTTTTALRSKSCLRKRSYNNSTKTRPNSLDERKMALYAAAEKALAVEENVDKEFAVTGKKMAFKLKRLDDQQKLIAEKLLSDIMFYGTQGKLELDCSIYFPSKQPQTYYNQHRVLNEVPESQQNFNMPVTHRQDQRCSNQQRSDFNSPLTSDLKEYILLQPRNTNSTNE